MSYSWVDKAHMGRRWFNLDEVTPQTTSLPIQDVSAHELIQQTHALLQDTTYSLSYYALPELKTWVFLLILKAEYGTLLAKAEESMVYKGKFWLVWALFGHFGHFYRHWSLGCCRFLVGDWRCCSAKFKWSDKRFTSPPWVTRISPGTAMTRQLLQNFISAETGISIKMVLITLSDYIQIVFFDIE